MLRWRFKRNLVVGLGFLCLSATIMMPNYSSAIDGDIEVEVGILPVLTITTPTTVRIVLEPGGPASIAEMPVYIATNNQTGLHAAVSLDKVSTGGDDTFIRSLVNNYDPNYYLEPLEESIVNIDDFPFDHWGCTFGDDMRYEGLNTSDKPTIRYLTHNPSANEKRYFLCAARASKFQVAGLYDNTIMMTAVPNVIPDTISTITYMQEINETVIASMEIDQSYQLVDGRDKKIYWVTKMQDGHVWMTQNLDYDLEAKTDGSELAEWGGEYDATASKLYKDGGNLVYDVDTDSYIDSSTLAFNSEKLHYHIGSFYNIEASERSGDGGSVIYADASGLCPFSWTVPDGMSSRSIYSNSLLDGLMSTYGSNIASSMYLAPMGYINDVGVLSGVGSEAYYLGNTKQKTSSDVYDARKVISINSGYSVSMTSLLDTTGGFIRCVAVPGRRYTISFKNTSNSVTLDDGTSPVFEQSILPEAIDVISYDTKYALSTNNLNPTNIPNGYTFLGWTNDENNRTTANVSSVVNLGNTQEVIRASDDGSNRVDFDLFPAWEHNYDEPVLTVEHNSDETRTLDDIVYLQDMNSEIVLNTNENAIKLLTDSRDGKKYWVRKLEDGNIWMEQNLDLSFDEPITLTPEDTNISESRVFSNDDEGIRQEHVAGGYGVNEFDLISTASDDVVWRTSHGSKYNRYTVLGASEDVSEVTGDYTESICPKGWQLPSASSISDVFYRDNYHESFGYTFSMDNLATATPPNELSTGEVLHGELVPVDGEAISHTANLTDEGVKTGSYDNNLGNSYIRGTNRASSSNSIHYVTIPDATELHITIYSGGESCCDKVYLYGSSGNQLNAFGMGSAGTSTYSIGDHSYSGIDRRQVVVSGDTVGFGFYTDGSVINNGFGYFAIVRGYKELPVIYEGNPLTVFSTFTSGENNHTSFTFGARCVAKSAANEGKTLRHISTMQEMRPSVCEATPVGTEVQLTDTRDNQTYFVRKMSDGRCWMVQNLAFRRTLDGAIYSWSTDMLDRISYTYGVSSYASNPGHTSAAVGVSNDVVTIEYGYPIAKIDQIPMNSYFRKFYSGLYYNYASANIDTSGYGYWSICPRGWRMPTASDAFIQDENFSHEELGKVFTSNATVDFGGNVYLTSTIDNTNRTVSLSNGTTVSFDDVNFYPVRCIAK